MTMLAIMKFINVSQRQKGTTVHLLLPLDRTDVSYFLSVDLERLWEEKKKKSQLRTRQMSVVSQ